MAVEAPVPRNSFDPWNHWPGHEEDDERCKGCRKISEARAAAAKAAAQQLVPPPSQRE